MLGPDSADSRRRGSCACSDTTRLYGHLKYFHPSDAAAELDWDAFAVLGVSQVVEAKSRQELVAVLRAIVGPVAPTVTVGLDGGAGVARAPNEPKVLDGLKTVAWQHLGIGLHTDHGTYQSRRVYANAGKLQDPLFDVLPDRGLGRNGGSWRQHDSPAANYGVPAPLRRIGRALGSGTRVTVRPDPAIFRSTEFSYELIRDRMRELAALRPPLLLSLRDERTLSARVQCPEGIVALASDGRIVSGEQLAPALRIQADDGIIGFDAAVTWRRGHGAAMRSYVNMQRTRDGGSHARGLAMGLMDAARRVGGPRGKGARKVTEGMCAAIHLLVRRGTAFKNPTKDKLDDAEAEQFVRQAVREKAAAFFTEHADALLRA